jgi:hypothetical protein
MSIIMPYTIWKTNEDFPLEVGKYGAVQLPWGTCRRYDGYRSAGSACGNGINTISLQFQ